MLALIQQIYSNMKKRVNLGRIENGVYYKSVVFSKAVLWKDRTLSLPPKVINAIATQDVKRMVFSDPTKFEKWIFDAEKVLKTMMLKQVGQEEQYYFPIDLAKRVSIETGQEIPYEG